MVRRHLKVHGRVQGVGFRASAKQTALELNLTGWVKNKHDGTVEIEVEGDPVQIDAFIDSLEEGPNPFVKVESIDLSAELPEENPRHFQIIE